MYMIVLTQLWNPSFFLCDISDNPCLQHAFTDIMASSWLSFVYYQ